MTLREIHLRAGALAILFFNWPAYAADQITYQDNVLPLIQANCAKCHNEDKKKADLDLTTYQGALKGGGSGAVLSPGNPDASKLWKSIRRIEEPFMPPNLPPLPDKDLEIFKKWIQEGLLENIGGKAVPAFKQEINIALEADSVGKPEGAPPMPKDLRRDVVVHTMRTTAITGLASSPWAPLIAVAGQKQVLLFHAETLDLLGILPFTEGEPVEVKFDRSGQILLASGGRGAKSGRVLAWDVVSGKLLRTLGDDYDTVLCADIRPDKSQVARGGPSRILKICSTQSGELQHKIKKHADWVSAIAFSPNGQMLASADRNGGLSVWDPDNGQELFTLAGHKSAVTALSWRGDSRILASSSEDGSVKLWEMEQGKQTKTWTAHGGGTLCVNYSHDGRLVTCGRDNAVRIWDGNGKKLSDLESFCDLPLRAVFSCDNSRIFASDFGGRVAVWSVANGKRLGVLDANPAPQPAHRLTRSLPRLTAQLRVPCFSRNLDR